MKDKATDSVHVSHFSSCMGDGPPRQTNKCSGLKVTTKVTFTAKIEVIKCFKDPYSHLLAHLEENLPMP